MVIEIVVPELGESITEGTVAAWLKQVGDLVAVDEPVLELETDKATVEICAPKAGVLTEIVVGAGEDVEVGALLGRIGEAGEAMASAPAAASKAPSAKTPAARPAPKPAISQLDPARLSRSGPGGTVTRDDLLEFAGITGGDLSRHGPAVRKLVADHGLDPSEIPASGRDGRITKADVQNFVMRREEPPTRSPQPETEVEVETAPAPQEERVRMSRMRRTIAGRLKEAQNTAAILTTFNEVDMGPVRELRKRHREEFETKHGVRLGYTSFFAKACVAGLKQIPAVNAEIDGDTIVYKHHYDISMAVSTPNGLVVPVIRDCDGKSFAEIEASLADLAQRARDGSLGVEEMQGGTFSITNGGVFGSLLSTPILNRPQSAILGLHKIEDRPVAREGAVVIRPMMYLALSYDHRLVDGREAVTFLIQVKEAIESPARLLLEL